MPIKWITLEGSSKRKISRNEKSMNRKKKNICDYYECLENNEGESADASGSNNSELGESQ